MISTGIFIKDITKVKTVHNTHSNSITCQRWEMGWYSIPFINFHQSQTVTREKKSAFTIQITYQRHIQIFINMWHHQTFNIKRIHLNQNSSFFRLKIHYRNDWNYYYFFIWKITDDDFFSKSNVYIMFSWRGVFSES